METTPIYLAAKDLAVRVLRVTQNYPKLYRYTVGEEMHKCAVAVLKYIALGIVTKDREVRIKAIEQFQAEFLTLKTLIEVSFEARWISQKAYADFLVATKSVGAQGSAWKNAQYRGRGQSSQDQGRG